MQTPLLLVHKEREAATGSQSPLAMGEVSGWCTVESRGSFNITGHQGGPEEPEAVNGMGNVGCGICSTRQAQERLDLGGKDLHWGTQPCPGPQEGTTVNPTELRSGPNAGGPWPVMCCSVSTMELFPQLSFIHWWPETPLITSKQKSLA